MIRVSALGRERRAVAVDVDLRAQREVLRAGRRRSRCLRGPVLPPLFVSQQSGSPSPSESIDDAAAVETRRQRAIDLVMPPYLLDSPAASGEKDTAVLHDDGA